MSSLAPFGPRWWTNQPAQGRRAARVNRDARGRPAQRWVLKQYGLDQLNLDLMGAPDGVLQAFDITVAGTHAIAVASSAAPADGVVLLNLPASDTAANLLTQHLSFTGGHA